MKVFVFGTRGFPNIQGGVEAHCERLYTSMPKGIEITIFRRKPYIIDKVTKYESIKFIDLPSTKIKGIEAFLHSLLCSLYCLLHHPDIVHIHNIGPGLFTPLLRLFKVKVVLTYHSSNYEHAKWGYLAKKILKLGEFCSLRFSNHIIFVNLQKLKSFPKKIQEKSSFIPNGIQKTAPAMHYDIINSMGLQPYEYFLSVGRITQEKGFDYLIDAYLMSKITIPLVIVGGIDHASNYVVQIQEKTKQYSNIILAGYSEGEKLRQLYTFAKAFILPSYNEGYPIVLTEAINYHKQILASNIEANIQIGLPNESYFRVGNVEELAKRIKEISQQNNFEVNYQQSFPSWEEIALRVSFIYSHIVK